MKSDLPNVHFGGRIKQSSVIEKLATATATIHLFKPSYAETGFITGRWVEAAMACTLGFVPDNFWLPDELKNKWKELGLIVTNGKELAKSYNYMSENAWKEGVLSQREFIFSLSGIQQWLDILEK